MFSSSLIFAKRFFDFLGQTCENIIIGHRIIVCKLLLMHQRNVDERHQRNGMIALTTFVVGRIGIVALRNELGCIAIVLLIFWSNHHFYFFVIDVQRDMLFASFLSCHACFSLFLFVAEDSNAFVYVTYELRQSFFGSCQVAISNLDHLGHLE